MLKASLAGAGSALGGVPATQPPSNGAGLGAPDATPAALLPPGLFEQVRQAIHLPRPSLCPTASIGLLSQKHAPTPAAPG